jgi:hypothetical protein
MGDAMKKTLYVLAVGWVLMTVCLARTFGQSGSEQSGAGMFQTAEQSMALILAGEAAGHVKGATAGMIIRSDGIVITSYRPIKEAQAVQVRLSDGEVYDQVELLGFDERRNVATLHIAANGLPSFSIVPSEQVTVGEKIEVLNADGTMTWVSAGGVLGQVRLADEILGAGRGYRVLEFSAPGSHSGAGGALLDARGQLLGLVPASASGSEAQFAVPMASVAGLANQSLHTLLGNGKNLVPPAHASHALSAPAEQPSPAADLADARSLKVTSKTMYFSPFMLEKELLNNSSFRTLEISVVAGDRPAGLVVNIDRPIFTYDFTYSVSEEHSGVVLATGKVVAIDGPHAAEAISKKLVEEFEKARAAVPAKFNRSEAASLQ